MHRFVSRHWACVFGIIAMLLATCSVVAAAEFTPAKYDLSALPPYKPEQMALGVVRIYGTPLESLVGRWAFEFRQKQGHVRLKAYLINTSQAFAGLLTGQADIGLMGHRTWHTSLMGFHQAFGYDPLEIRFATGSYDDPEGSTPGLMFIVHKNNPLRGLTLQQIDGGVKTDPPAIGCIRQHVSNATGSEWRALPLALNAGGRYITPSPQTFFDGSYPMHNGAYLYLNRVPGKPLSTRDKEFVRFVLSREGQQIVADSRIFIPLNAAQVRAELKKLD